MTRQTMDDLRRVLLGLLYLLVFGWMAAQVLPGVHGGGTGAAIPQLAQGEDVIPPME